MLIRELMNKKVITVHENDDVRSICRKLTKHKISGVPVVNKAGKLVGFVSERDVIAAVSKPNFINRVAMQLMTKKVRTIADDAQVMHASKIFSEELYRHLPVTKGGTKSGRLVGIITRKDIANHMMKHYY